jgi:AraC family transcriptional regulator, regulatory protein of adaptative response / methylated-DNA-[protein]-cysteine methyltransferase
MVSFTDDDARWAAVERRDKTASNLFFYAVLTTGIYCCPGCPARLPLRVNVRFYLTATAAERAGYRACRRCQVDGLSFEDRQTALIRKACLILEQAKTYNLTELSKKLGVSRYHLHRQFKAAVGMTPKQYMTRHQK